MDHIDMNAAVVFVRVAQAGSFRAASKSLGMPKTSVSRKVAELETRLGVQLLQRTTRQVALTDAGRAYVDAAVSAIANLEAAEEAVSRQQREPQGRIRVTAPSPLGHDVLAPHLAEFMLLYPKVEVQLHLTYRSVDLLSERFDVALRYGALPDSSLVAVSLGASEQRVVASPTYLRAHAAPETPADLALHECLIFGVASPSLRATWTLVHGKSKTDVAVRGRFGTDDLLALRAAAVAGLGLARLPAPTIAADLASGALVPLLGGYTSVPVPLHVVHAGGHLLPARTRALVNFLAERMAVPGRAPRKKR